MLGMTAHLGKAALKARHPEEFTTKDLLNGARINSRLPQEIPRYARDDESLRHRGIKGTSSRGVYDEGSSEWGTYLFQLFPHEAWDDVTLNG